SSSGFAPPLRQGGPTANAGPGEFSPEQPIVVHGGEPVKVQCRGPFELKAAENLATFEHSVVVTRQPSGAAAGTPPDTLTCHRLELHLANAADKKAPSGEKKPRDKKSV